MAHKHLECDGILNAHKNINGPERYPAKDAEVSLNMFIRHTCSMEMNNPDGIRRLR
jgi:hypothetical protein